MKHRPCSTCAVRALLAALLVSLGACSSAVLASPDVAEEIRHAVAADAGDAALSSFYERREYRTYWTGSPAAADAARALVDVLRGAGDDGLPAADGSLDGMREGDDSADARAAAESDVAFTQAYRRFGRRLAGGSAEARRADPHWHITAPPVEPLDYLDPTPSAAAVRRAVERLRPPHAQYAALREALHRYRGIARAGGWPPLGSGPTLDAGMSGPDIGTLRRRLAATGDLAAAPGGDADVFDDEVHQAVLRFQRRHGLEADGRVGRRTRAALSVPASQRAAQLAAAMERWRWMPRDLGDRYVYVNVPRFVLDAVAGGRSVTSMRVIVGRRDRPTPSFAGTISRFIVNPMWYVPNLIARVDLLPKQRHDPGYFAAQKIRVFADPGYSHELDPAEVDWSAVPARPFPYYLRQDPGPGNSLGRLKFLVRNPFDIYLHDTPARGLFDRRVRAFSSGCVRVEDAAELAAFLMNDAARWPVERVRGMMDAGERVGVPLPTGVPLYVTYFTAWVDGNGTVQFRDDLYERDTAVTSCGCPQAEPECA